MKPKYFIWGSILIALNIAYARAYCKTCNSDGDLPYYVVIGAFSIHSNAIRFTAHAHHDFKLNAKYELNPQSNLYYVYVLRTTDADQALGEVKRLRTKPEFTDAWVYCGLLGKAISKIEKQSLPGKGPENVSAEYVKDLSADNGGGTLLQLRERTAESKTKAGEKGKSFYFKIYNATDRRAVAGDVDVIDPKRLRKIITYQGNIPVRVPPLPNSGDSIALVCEVFGYRKIQKHISYEHPVGRDISIEDSAIVVPFELVRLQKGDIAVMYNVYFFKDAAMMRPESRYEVNNLLEMLKDNPDYKIKIHGHTNGDAYGKIISMKEDSKHFFSLHHAHEGFGSAKKLSEVRAQTIRNYLVNNGIDPQRMEIKAWGGKRPLLDKHSIRAQENVRVEIEILEDGKSESK